MFHNKKLSRFINVDFVLLLLQVFPCIKLLDDLNLWYSKINCVLITEIVLVANTDNMQKYCALKNCGYSLFM